MKFNTCTGITWSLLELTGLLEDEDSRVYFERTKKHIGLHPFHLTNLHAALNEILSSGLNSYDPELKGFLIAYKNPTLLTPLGGIFYDTCFIHVDVEVDFYIFRPEVECSLKGIVNKKGLSHIGLLVHKAFNVSIPKPEDADYWPGDKVEIGQEVRFTITHLDCTSKLPFIRGHLDEDNYLLGCKVFSKEENEELDDGEAYTSENHRNTTINNSLNINVRASHLNFDSDSESEDTEPAVEPVSAKPSKKNKTKSKTTVENKETQKSEKKQSKKSKGHTEVEADKTVQKSGRSSHYISDNSDDNDNEAPENENTITSGATSLKVKKEKKKSAKKSLEKSESSDTEHINGETIIKSENPHSSNELETVPDKVQDVKKRSKKNKILADPEEDVAQSFEKPTKKGSKKSKASSLPDDFTNVEVKSEKDPVTEETSRLSGVNNEEAVNTGAEENEQEQKKQKKKSSKARSKKSVTPDGEEVPGYQTVQIKTEIGLETVKIKTEKPSNDNADTRLNGTENDVNVLEENQSQSSVEDSVSSTKKKNKKDTEKKTARKPKSIIDPKFGCGSPFKIKSESSTSCDSSSEIGKQKDTKKKSVKDKSNSDSSENVKVKSENTTKKQSKKSKVVEVKIDPEIKIKEESVVENKKENDGTPVKSGNRKRANRSQSDSDDDSDISSPKKHSKKPKISKEESTLTSVKVKVEETEACK